MKDGFECFQIQVFPATPTPAMSHNAHNAISLCNSPPRNACSLCRSLRRRSNLHRSCRRRLSTPQSPSLRLATSATTFTGPAGNASSNREGMLGLRCGGALIVGYTRGISASVDAFTTEITARYSPRTLIEASFDRGLGDRMLLVSHVGWELASLELGKGS